MSKLYSGAEIVFKCLEDQGVDFIFGSTKYDRGVGGADGGRTRTYKWASAISLSVDRGTILENQDISKITATISASINQDVTVNLSVSGTAKRTAFLSTTIEILFSFV